MLIDRSFYSLKQLIDATEPSKLLNACGNVCTTFFGHPVVESINSTILIQVGQKRQGTFSQRNVINQSMVLLAMNNDRSILCLRMQIHDLSHPSSEFQ